MTRGAFTAWLLAHLDLDTWFTEATLTRRLAGISQRPEGWQEPAEAFTAARIIQAAKAMGAVETQRISQQDWYCLPGRKHYTATKRAAADATRSGSQSAHILNQ